MLVDIKNNKHKLYVKGKGINISYEILHIKLLAWLYNLFGKKGENKSFGILTFKGEEV